MKKLELKTMIREIVREEVAMSIQKVIKEITQPTKQISKPKKKTGEKKQYSKNSVLNEVLNETADADEWKTLSDNPYTSDRRNEVINKMGYGELMTGNSTGNLAADMGVDPNNAPDFLTKDYSEVMKALDKKDGKV
jgi:hypothetical protein